MPVVSLILQTRPYHEVLYLAQVAVRQASFLPFDRAALEWNGRGNETMSTAIHAEYKPKLVVTILLLHRERFLVYVACCRVPYLVVPCSTSPSNAASEEAMREPTPIYPMRFAHHRNKKTSDGKSCYSPFPSCWPMTRSTPLPMRETREQRGIHHA